MVSQRDVDTRWQVSLRYSSGILGAVNDFFPRLSCFGFRRKLACTKNQQDTDKPIKHNRNTVSFCVLTSCFSYYYHLSYINFTSSKFAPAHFLTLSPPKYDNAPDRASMRVSPNLHHHRSSVQYTKIGPLHLSAVPLKETYMEPFFGFNCCFPARVGTPL